MDAAEKSKLEEQCASVRAELKLWEGEYAKAHEGKKPSREAIKANPEIAVKYKQYSSLRNTLAGKPPKPASKPPVPKTQPAVLSPVKRRQKSTYLTPSKSRVQNFHTPTASRTAQPNFHTPSTEHVESPYVPRIIGPTPQRDGRVLGLFDLMEDADTKSPSKVGFADASTPQKRRLEDAEEDGLFSRGRTPMSASKRQLLDSFLTPTKKTLGASDAAATGATPKSVSKDFSTPAFLKRRMAPVAYSQDSNFTSPGRPARVGRPQFTKGLSSLVASLRKVEEEAYEDDEEALREMEAGGGDFADLPKRPATQNHVKPERAPLPLSEGASGAADDDDETVEDSQLGMRLLSGLDDEGRFDEPLSEEVDRGRPLRQFKKRMPKRTTRKVNIRPTLYKRPSDSAGPALPEEDVVGADDAYDDDDGGDDAVPETQILSPGGEEDEDEYQDEDDAPQKGRIVTATAAAAAAREAAKKEGTAKPAKKVNELAHANFKRLKLRNFGAKGGPGYNSKFRRRR